ANIVDKIAEGKIAKYFQETCLLEQLYVKNTDMTINGLLKENIIVIGENIIVKRFVRWILGETSKEEE
ncbi:MAG TPA: hypothetical protein VF347_02345, partial [Candidatus Humimicrobiaceae bacterium]